MAPKLLKEVAIAVHTGLSRAIEWVPTNHSSQDDSIFDIDQLLLHEWNLETTGSAATTNFHWELHELRRACPVGM